MDAREAYKLLWDKARERGRPIRVCFRVGTIRSLAGPIVALYDEVIVHPEGWIQWVVDNRRVDNDQGYNPQVVNLPHWWAPVILQGLLSEEKEELGAHTNWRSVLKDAQEIGEEELNP